MKYIIGIDSGGTKTEAIVYDLTGKECQRVITGFGNMLVDHEQGLANIKSAIQTVLTGRQAKDCQLLVLGLAGIESGGLKETLANELAVFQVPLVLLSDGQLAHYAFLKGESGILLIAGTGSIAIGRVKNQWVRVGGWGHLFGDDGSGYSIGKQAIQRALYEYDIGAENSLLTEKLMAHFNVETTIELVKIAYQLSKDQLASLAKLVAELAYQDPVAATILSKAGTDLGSEVKKLVTKMHWTEKQIKIGLNGSVIEQNKQVRQAFFSYVDKCAFEPVFIEKEHSSAKGAYYFYQKNGAVIE
ncbi:BadF/BadG/BcrA/BcrD ATPase family protein [Candidatus Enterococcus mansonii]|uniref:ATPase BadF/BadG/BcrA/BcrD type domain-containing protein n=1 Tax=Candidatus Enterococcus mansonii TaxID=1834181 RepID=A0A242C643_9ENTE|nr:BadF/BadG/BcrA/BcrD ATPase family protein [Enterococcus sp. 4G2_DIV0659]OTO05661.1 hypothetical protein A5880_002836 [Enterococcus sp. 4G2_DIV0659]